MRFAAPALMVAFLLPSTAALWLDVVGLLASLAVLALSGDQFVVGLARVASSLPIRPTVAAALIGGLGTSIAELIVAGVAAPSSPELAVGSLVGSVVANVCLALAVAVLVTPLEVDSAVVRREAPLSVVAVALFAALADGHVAMVAGTVMLAVLVPIVGILLFMAARGARGGHQDALGTEMAAFAPARSHRWAVETVRSVALLAVMLGGAELMVTSSLGIARHLGISQGFAGITLVGIGTSAPLVAASIQAARRGQHDLVVGNVLGGNLFIALGGGSLVGFLAHGAGAHVGGVALALMVAVVVAAWLAMARGNTLTRAEAVVLLLAYGATIPFLNR